MKWLQSRYGNIRQFYNGRFLPRFEEHLSAVSLRTLDLKARLQAQRIRDSHRDAESESDPTMRMQAQEIAADGSDSPSDSAPAPSAAAAFRQGAMEVSAIGLIPGDSESDQDPDGPRTRTRTGPRPQVPKLSPNSSPLLVLKAPFSVPSKPAGPIPRPDDDDSDSADSGSASGSPRTSRPTHPDSVTTAQIQEALKTLDDLVGFASLDPSSDLENPSESEYLARRGHSPSPTSFGLAYAHANLNVQKKRAAQHASGPGMHTVTALHDGHGHAAPPSSRPILPAALAGLGASAKMTTGTPQDRDQSPSPAVTVRHQPPAFRPAGGPGPTHGQGQVLFAQANFPTTRPLWNVPLSPGGAGAGASPDLRQVGMAAGRGSAKMGGGRGLQPRGNANGGGGGGGRGTSGAAQGKKAGPGGSVRMPGLGLGASAAILRPAVGAASPGPTAAAAAAATVTAGWKLSPSLRDAQWDAENGGGTGGGYARTYLAAHGQGGGGRRR